jgi:hypothetical protein
LLLGWRITQVPELEHAYAGTDGLPADSTDKFMKRDFQCACEFDDRAEPRLALSALKHPDLSAVKRCHFSKCLL